MFPSAALLYSGKFQTFDTSNERFLMYDGHVSFPNDHTVLIAHNLGAYRGSPGREASARALLARSLMKHYLRTLHGDGMGIGTTQWLRVQERTRTWLPIETSRITPHLTWALTPHFM